jgi:hypothetical protein
MKYLTILKIKLHQVVREIESRTVYVRLNSLEQTGALDGIDYFIQTT